MGSEGGKESLERSKNSLQKKETMILLNFLNLLYLQVSKFYLLKKNTIKQSQSDYWFSHRICRITSSKFDRVFTRSKTLQKIKKSNGRVNA